MIDPYKKLNPASRLWRADRFRKSRFHDQKGNLLPADQLRYLPLNTWYTLRRVLLDKRPESPWLAFNAIARLESLLRPEWSMVEFGSGASTHWFAQRVSAIRSIEHNPAWHERVRPTLPGNVIYELRTGDDYANLDEVEDGSLDFVVVDGIKRDQCVRSAIPKLRAGGWLYLDNSDTDMTIEDGEMRVTERSLRAGVADRGGHIEQATGLLVGNMIPVQWTLAQFD